MATSESHGSIDKIGPPAVSETQKLVPQNVPMHHIADRFLNVESSGGNVGGEQTERNLRVRDPFGFGCPVCTDENLGSI